MHPKSSEANEYMNRFVKKLFLKNDIDGHSDHSLSLYGKALEYCAINLYLCSTVERQS